MDSENFTRLLHRWTPGIMTVVLIVFFLTLISILFNHISMTEQRQNQLQLDMAQKGYCLQSISGTSTLVYQPCGRFKEELK